jgi:hypothetical protein
MTSDYGTYRLSYTPPESTGREDYPNIAIEMSTSGDANVEQMLRFYEAFLAASGFMLNGELQVVKPDQNPWDDFLNSGVKGRQATDLIAPSSIINSPAFNFRG